VTLKAGTSIGRYEILGPLGAGGMGEVYRARDAQLKRDVALKVLPEGFATDSDRVARFTREAHVLASLNHPNIAAIYGFEEANDRQALVLELVEGPTLVDRLRDGRIPVDEALPIARQIAEALEAAHGVDVIHRDLKPGNVKLRPDGTVKVLDFGLAKAMERPDRAPRDGTASPTVTSPAMTEHGMILGTAAYMSPEQAKGRPADHRSDVWALGVVLFEMLSGRPPFRGDDVSDTLAAVLRADPEWTDLPVETPAAVHRLLRRCLHKDARRRWQHMGDVRVELADIEQGTLESPALGVPRRMSRATLVAGALLFTLMGAAIGRWSLPGGRSAGSTPVAFTLTPDSGQQRPDAGSVRGFGVSWDGRYVAYAALKDGRRQLFLRAIDRPDAVAIGGTENATYPAFSPDGSSVAFWADGWVKRVSTAGGAATSVAPAQAPRGLTWAPGDRIVFTPSAESGLHIVAASGGTPEPLTELDAATGETNHRWPVALPDGRGVLFAVQRRSRTELDIEAVTFGSKTRIAVRAGAFPVQVLDTGHLVYSAVNGDTFAAPFDIARMTLTGPSIPLPERPGYTEVPGTTSLALSPGGTMASVPLQEPAGTLVVVGRDGTERGMDVPPRNYFSVAVSRSGRIAVVVQAGIADWDIWTTDAAGNAPLRRATVEGFNIWPVWSSDDRLFYSEFKEKTWRLVSRDMDRSETPRQLLTDLPQETAVLGQLSDGSLAYTIILPQQVPYVVKEGGPRRTIAPPLTGQFTRELHGLSPNGRWLAYTSLQSGQSDVYVTAFPEGGITRQVSRNGGAVPVWAKTGQQLFFFQGRHVVSVTLNPDGSTSAPAVVLTGDYVVGRATFDVFPDGSLLMIKELPAAAPSLQVVVNWTALRGLARER
jgi:serine/threonine-protein kinase